MSGMNESPTIAYVFWHWMRSDAPARDYEGSLKAFQEALRAHAPPGYRRAAVFRHARAAWLPDDATCYVDWYVVDGGAALDALNDAAVSPPCRAVHDAAAARAAGGTAGLYTLKSGALASGDIRCATWFRKPEGVSYEAFDADLAERFAARPVELWRRRMVLGPTPEMCLLSGAPVELPDACAPFEVAMQPLWPGAGGDPGRIDRQAASP